MKPGTDRWICQVLAVERRSPVGRSARIVLFVGLACLFGRADATAGAESRLDGAYVATVSGMQNNPITLALELKVRQVYYRFSADGRFCPGLPRNGDLSRLDGDRPECGSYDLGGGKIRLSPASGRGQALDFARVGGDLRMGRDLFRRISPSDGLSLDGTYRNSTFTSSGAAAAVRGGVAAQHEIKFSADGRFSQRGFIGSTFEAGGAGATSVSRSAGEGTYAFRGYQLVLRYADGRSATHAFFKYPGAGGVIVIDGVAYAAARH